MSAWNRRQTREDTPPAHTGDGQIAVQSQKTGKDEKEQNRKHQSLSGGRYKGEDGAVQCSKKGTG